MLPSGGRDIQLSLSQIQVCCFGLNIFLFCENKPNVSMFCLGLL